MKHLVLSAGLWKLKNSNDIKSGEKDLTREILMTLVSQGILETEDCCTYTLVGAAVDCSIEDHSKIAYVDPNGNDLTAVIGSSHCPFATIQGAVDRIIADNLGHMTVKILPGRYFLTAPIDFTNKSFLTFDLSAGVRIYGDEDVPVFQSTGSSATTTITGLGIIYGDTTGAAIETASPGLTVKGIAISNVNGSAIGGTWGNLYLYNAYLESAEPSVTSSPGSIVSCFNSVASSVEDPLLTWQIQGLVVDPSFSIA